MDNVRSDHRLHGTEGQVMTQLDEALKKMVKTFENILNRIETLESTVKGFDDRLRELERIHGLEGDQFG